MSSSFKKERAVLRKRLQAHRKVMLQDLGDLAAKPARHNGHLGHLFESEGTFPRSVTMRLLTNRQNFLLLAIAELFPLLVRHFLKSSARPPQQTDTSEASG